MNLLSSFLDNASQFDTRIAIIDGQGQSITYGALAKRSAQLASNWQKTGIGKGDRVLLALSVSIDLYAGIAALWRLGATIVFPEPAFGFKGLRLAINMTRPKGLLTHGKYRLMRLVTPELWTISASLHMTPDQKQLDDVCDVSPDHPALISFTSGSTGKPKGIERSHGFMAAQDRCIATFLKPQRTTASAEETQIDLVAFPVFVIANLGLGITSVLPTWSRPEKATPKALQALVLRHKISRALVPPSLCEKITLTSDLSSLHTIFTGGGPVFPDLLKRLQKHLLETEVCTVYGSTEAEPVAYQYLSQISQADWHDMANGKGLLAGQPIEQIKLQLADDEILVTGEHVNKGYIDGKGDENNKLQQNGRIWHKTGDAGRLDNTGRLWLLGRQNAKSGAFYPFMIEAGARSWPGVRQVALLPGATSPTLVIEGASRHLPDWQSRAKALGDFNVRQINKIPMDRRHHSKIDHAQLKKML